MNEQAVLAPWPEHERNSSVLFNNVPCAVLVPFIKNAGGLDLLFEVRSKTLRWQPGDISFPGGKIEASDVTPLAAAIRETGEELNIPPEKIRVLASLAPLETVTGVTLNPFVAEVSSVEDIRCTAEVDHTFTVPLQWFMEHEPELAEMDLATRPGATFPVDIPYAGNPMEWRRRKTYFVYIYRYEGYHIWGMTAQIVKECIDIIKAM